MNVNISYCQKCKNLFCSSNIDNQIFLYCCLKFSPHTHLMVLKSVDSSFFINAKDKTQKVDPIPPPECPYILEHTLSTDEEREQALKLCHSILFENSSKNES